MAISGISRVSRRCGWAGGRLRRFVYGRGLVIRPGDDDQEGEVICFAARARYRDGLAAKFVRRIPLATQFTELPGEPATFPGAGNSYLDGCLTRFDERLKDWRPGSRCLGGHHLYVCVGDKVDAVIVRPFTTRCSHVASPGRFEVCHRLVISWPCAAVEHDGAEERRDRSARHNLLWPFRRRLCTRDITIRRVRGRYSG